MVQNSMGAERGTHREDPLHPKLLEYTKLEDKVSEKRIKVSKFKRKTAVGAAVDLFNTQDNFDTRNEGARPKSVMTYTQVVDAVIKRESARGADVYFTKEYAGVNELVESGIAKFFEIRSKNGHITHTAIKREIHTTIDGERYYDLISPYGYGGPVVHSHTNMDALIAEFEQCFSVYCQNNNIVSEFVRFHPVMQNQEDFKDIYDVTYMRNTVGTDLGRFDDPFQSEFSRTARTKIRKRLRDERFSFSVERGFENIEEFIEIYNITMKRHDAGNFYYFNKEYFYALKDRLQDDILTISVKLDGEVIAMGLYMLSGDIIHDHLNGTRPEYLEHSPAYLLKYASLKWGQENGYALVHYGGGVSNAEDDQVLRFKKRFGKHTEFKYHIGKKVWNAYVYRELCQERGMDRDRDFFPAYR